MSDYPEYDAAARRVKTEWPIDATVKLYEVRGNDGASHRTAAKNTAKRAGYTVIDVRPSGERAPSGSLVWAVWVEDPDADA